MRRPIKNGLGAFDKKLLAYIKNQQNSDAVSILLANRIKPCNVSDNSGKTLLHYAAEYNNTIFAKYLIDNGWNIEAVDNDNNTPLITAVSNHNEQVIKILLDANAKIGDFHMDKNAMTDPMIKKSPEDLAMLKILFDKVTEEFFNDHEVAMKLFEIYCPLPAVIFFKNVELTKMMLDLCCSVDDRLHTTNETALHVAVRLLDIENVKILIHNGADVNARDNSGYTPLSIFKISPNDTDDKLEILKCLLDCGASLTQDTWKSFTAMSILLSEGDSRTVKVIMPYIDFSEKDKNGKTPFHYLAENFNFGITDVLQVQDYGLNAQDKHGKTPLAIAADNCNLEMVKFLLENDANPNIIDRDGFTVLYGMIKEYCSDPDRIVKYRSIIELLLQYGADAQYLKDGEYPIFEIVSKYEFVKPVIAHLALLESSGVVLNNFIYQNIQHYVKFQNYFQLCKLDIETMKRTVIYESITLYKLLFEDKKKIEIYARNPNFVAVYENFVKIYKCDISYYANTFNLRVGDIINLVQAREKAANIICEIMKLPCSMTGIIGLNIVKNLKRKDVDNMMKIYN